MNAPLPANAILPASRDVLPDAWINRLFCRLEGLYGARFHDLWKGTDLANVKATWAEKLGGFADKPECLKAALDACDERPWCPNLPEFITLCRESAITRGTVVKMLEVPVLSKEEAAKRSKEIGLPKMRPSFDGLLWAKKLREKYLVGERLLPVQISMASEALGEKWVCGKIEPARKSA